MGLSIIDKINKEAETLTIEDINGWVLDEVIEHLKPKIEALSRYTFGVSEVGRRAFLESSRKLLGDALELYILKAQHWKTRDDIQPYLITCLNRASNQDRRELNAESKYSVPICPACKVRNVREFLIQDGKKMWRCRQCSDISKHLETSDVDEAIFRGIFAVHSRKGFRCPDCKRFVPDSYVNNRYSLSCPYPDCTWFGVFNEIEPMAHPVSLGMRSGLSLNANINNSKIGSESNETWLDRLKDKSPNAYTKVVLTQQYELELGVINDVVDAQMLIVQREPNHRGIKKRLMYQAFKNTVKKSPEDMVMYLAHQKHPVDHPIQARIFQEFVRLVQDELPFEVQKRGRMSEIYSLLDVDLDLFIGLTTFDAVVDKDGFIPNNTRECYVGGRQAKDFGPCFIGYLCSIYDGDNNSLMDSVDYYTFSQIKVKDIDPGTSVHVKHMYMPSHYEMNGLVPLQRIRRKIVDSVHVRLYGEKRKVNRKPIK